MGLQACWSTPTPSMVDPPQVEQSGSSMALSSTQAARCWTSYSFQAPVKGDPPLHLL